MSEVDLSTLSGPELRGLLDSARNRGQAAQAYQILQELAERRARDEDRRTRKAARSPRVIAMELGDPLELPDEFADSPPAAEAPAMDAPLTLDSDRTRMRQDKPPGRAAPPPRRPPEPPSEGRAAKRRRWPVVGFAAGIALGVTVGFGIARETLSQPAGSATIFPAAPMLRSGEVSPPPPPTAAAAPAATPPAETAVPPPPPPPPPPSEAVQTPAEAATPEPVEATATPAEAPATETAAAELPAAKACAGATAADRTICADPALQRLQGELRRAYAEALEAHADRALLREHQLAWREARNDVSDPGQLARLYEARIRKLNAATAEARRAREGR